jgi:hypothetical protein
MPCCCSLMRTVLTARSTLHGLASSSTRVIGSLRMVSGLNTDAV